jgi:hypothetical protein
MLFYHSNNCNCNHSKELENFLLDKEMKKMYKKAQKEENKLNELEKVDFESDDDETTAHVIEGIGIQ